MGKGLVVAHGGGGLGPRGGRVASRSRHVGPGARATASRLGGTARLRAGSACSPRTTVGSRSGVRDLLDRFSRYREATIGGGDRAIHHLRAIQGICNAIVVALSGGIGAVGIESFGLAIGTAIGAGATSLAEGAVEREERVRRGVDDQFDVKGLLADVSASVVTNVVNALVSGVLAKQFTAVLGKVLAERIAPETLLAVMERLGCTTREAALSLIGRWNILTELLGSAGASILSGAVNAAIARLRRDPSAQSTDGLVGIVSDEVSWNAIGLLVAKL